MVLAVAHEADVAERWAEAIEAQIRIDDAIALTAGSSFWPAGPSGFVYPIFVPAESRTEAATILVDDGIITTLEPGEFRKRLELPPGNYLVEFRDPETGRRMHRGIVTVESGDEIELGFGAVQAPRVLDRPDAWKPL